MKFTEGMWRLKDEMKVDWMVNVERINERKDEVEVILSKLQRHRGDTLNSATVTAHITTPAEDIIGVEYVHWDGEHDKGPHFELNKTNPTPTIVHKPGKHFTYQSGDLVLDMPTSPNDLEINFCGKNHHKLTSHSWRSIGYFRDESTAPWTDGIFREQQGYMMTALDLGVGERIYGLGERFGPFVKNGQSIEVWNEDGGTSSELSYKNIPFYMSSRGYGVFINNSGKVSLEIQSERTTRVNISLPGQKLQYFVIYGPTPKDVLRKYTALTGRAAVPPAWSYNLWLTTSFTTQYDEATVTGFLDGFRERELPLGVFHFDCFWMKGYHWCDFEFDTDMFPDPAGYIKRLKERGLRISVWINPYVGQASRLFREGKEKGYFLQRPNGTVFQWDLWQAGMAIIDFTNPASCDWYRAHLTRLIDLGVDSFKTDFGERIPFTNIRYHNSADPARMHNYYTHLFNKTVHDLLLARRGPAGACLFARSATAGGQAFPVHWGGDCESTFEAMAETLRGGLSLALSGFAFWAHDIGGFEGTPSPALYQRWVQFGLLSSHSRLHGSGSFRVPWLFGEESCEVLRAFAKLKIALTPYLLAAAREAHAEGTPLMRAMLLEFPDDRNTHTLDTQYMLGGNLLVAPVFTESGEVSFYVPDSSDDVEWVSWFDHTKRYRGGRWYTETHGAMTLPLLVRPGSITPVNYTIKAPEERVPEGLELVVVRGSMKEAWTVEVVDPRDPYVVEEMLVVESKVEGVEVRGRDIKVTHF